METKIQIFCRDRPFGPFEDRVEEKVDYVGNLLAIELMPKDTKIRYLVLLKKIESPTYLQNRRSVYASHGDPNIGRQDLTSLRPNPTPIKAKRL